MIRLKQIANNFHKVSTPKADIYFSYETPIAFQTDTGDWYISENVWSQTTGKHLNQIDPDKSKRIKNTVFDSQLAFQLVQY